MDAIKKPQRQSNWSAKRKALDTLLDRTKVWDQAVKDVKALKALHGACPRILAEF